MILNKYVIAAGALAFSLTGISGYSFAESFPPITNPTVKSECSDCHMAFFAEMLPRKSWIKILNNLENHYGEDASVEPEALKEIIAFHTDHAADVLSSRGAQKWRKGLKKGEAPDRITTAPRFKRKHNDNEFKAMWVRNAVKTKADCVACHKDANRGLFDDD